MKRIQPKLTSSLTLIFLLAPAMPLRAGDTIDVPWNQICRRTADHEVQVTTASGDTVQGYCVAVEANGVSINVKGTKIQVARDQVARILMHRRGSQMKALGHAMRAGLAMGVRTLFSPAAMAGMIAIPGTIVSGAVAVPFCLLGDLGSKMSGNTEINLR